jgi:regulator of ribonuclease activity A
VIVVDGGESRRRALLGDQLAAAAADNGWSGLVIAGVVRDVEILRDTPLGIKALGSLPAEDRQARRGAAGHPIEIGGVTVHPGDYVYADANGVLSSTSLLWNRARQ